MSTEIEIAWAAGIVEGEGSMRTAIPRANVGITHRCPRTIDISVTQKDPEILYKLQNLFGGSVYLNNPRQPHPYCRWTLSGPRAANFIRMILPFLSTRRKEQAEKVLASHRPRKVQEILT